MSRVGLPLPLARVRSIAKSDPELHNISRDATIMLAHAAASFLSLLAKDSWENAIARRAKGKTLKLDDVGELVQERRGS